MKNLKTARFEIRVTPEEKAALVKLAEQKGVTASQLLRQVVASYVRRWAK